MKVLVTGGTGFIGSHTVLELLNAGHEVAVVDNLCNSSPESLRRVEQITGQKSTLHIADIRDRHALDQIFQDEAPIDAVIHFAALKAVGESVSRPMQYYDNNIAGTITLCQAMQAAGCTNIVFSSSATVYGTPATVPISEESPTQGATNPYGWTKLMMEQIFRDVQLAHPAWNIILLRYFNPIGAHASGLIGEDPAGIPSNLLPYIAQVAIGRLPELSVFGSDYPTPDGTGIRDYIHVVDLALGHLRALEALTTKPGLNIYNLGTGNGYSVLEVVQAFERASGRKVPYALKPRRPGDIAESWANPAKAHRELAWRATRDIDQMCRDAWNWQSQNPNGFAKE